MVKEEVIGKSVLGQDIMAYKVTQGAKGLPDGSRPAVLYNSTQHAREWISTEVERRMFKYVVDQYEPRRRRDQAPAATRELWFVPVVNPDGYDYTFANRARACGARTCATTTAAASITGRRRRRHQPQLAYNWNYDLEGASDDPSNETFHGASAGSEPEVQAMRGLEKRIKPEVPDRLPLVRAADPLPGGLAGRDAGHRRADDEGARRRRRPARPCRASTPRSRPSSTRPTATSPTTLLRAFGTQSYTVELDGGTGAGVGGTDGGPRPFAPGGFVFQDSEADIQAEFQKNLAFALDLAVGRRPGQPGSHLGNTAPDLVPTTFPISYGDPQTVEVNAKKSLGAVDVYWQVDGGASKSAPTTEYNGGERVRRPGHLLPPHARPGHGRQPATRCKVWFQAGAKHVGLRSPTAAKNDAATRCCCMAAEDYTGPSAQPAATEARAVLPRLLPQALEDAGIGFDVYDVDAADPHRADRARHLSHYKAVDLGDRRRPLRRARPASPVARATRCCSTTRSSRRATT